MFLIEFYSKAIGATNFTIGKRMNGRFISSNVMSLIKYELREFVKSWNVQRIEKLIQDRVSGIRFGGTQLTEEIEEVCRYNFQLVLPASDCTHTLSSGWH